jgi:hypothetical protein
MEQTEVQTQDQPQEQKEKWYNNRAKVIFSFQAFPPLGIYALLRSSAFTTAQKWLVVFILSSIIGLIIWSGIMRPINAWLMKVLGIGE